ncbi:sugar phosphate isomerase/epimerase family protein [Paenibacillus cellulositrophicus]|uniref:Sugar phosphate isomerase n=3 Tax=Paenibacillus TaxID=44249 RepID=A0A1R1EPV8_9BACL|nr:MULTISPECIES: sugar phosphate isomerase/epimerase family protein [Paenibacillus]MBB3128090.1 sugar phosphate isomerase/epimerase [Paenibacillus rhizosphaerae]MCM2998900.1 sugar phosphate isomerase/epimerase [Paenibacillus cellulositrophicus]MEC0177242.1 sugar phosphate isomerase/epimerase [Paenibacillus favisporus]OMF53845.1 sugar phosphate isomerase [Paenibacillus rhizosphaerae]OXL84272.1 sugar phosphate isomerase [Paenibacillus sp. SSG-1]
MKIGVSTYSLYRPIQSGEITVLGAIEKIAEMGGEHVEIVPIGYTLTGNPELVDQIVAKAKEVGIDVSNYAIGANFAVDTEEAYRKEIERVKGEVDIAARLGVKLMRHDVASRQDTSIKQFNQEVGRLAEACREIADYAAQYGITTSVENHGYYIQASDRVQTLVQAVDRPNFRTTLDVGNFMCADEDPVAAVKNNIPYASMVHIKDFYLRPAALNPGDGWFRTASGNFLRGAIAGHGDINLRESIRIIKESGFDGYFSIEFEGMEDSFQGTKIGLENVKRFWNEV